MQCGGRLYGWHLCVSSQLWWQGMRRRRLRWELWSLCPRPHLQRIRYVRHGRLDRPILRPHLADDADGRIHGLVNGPCTLPGAVAGRWRLEIAHHRGTTFPDSELCINRFWWHMHRSRGGVPCLGMQARFLWRVLFSRRTGIWMLLAIGHQRALYNLLVVLARGGPRGRMARQFPHWRGRLRRRLHQRAGSLCAFGHANGGTSSPEPESLVRESPKPSLTKTDQNTDHAPVVGPSWAPAEMTH